MSKNTIYAPSRLALVFTDRVVEAQDRASLQVLSPRCTKGDRTILEMNGDSGAWLYQTEFLQKERQAINTAPRSPLHLVEHVNKRHRNT
jgi:hypothetical protein